MIRLGGAAPIVAVRSVVDIDNDLGFRRVPSVAPVVMLWSIRLRLSIVRSDAFRRPIV